MSEIPKLRIVRPSDKSTTRFEAFLYEGNLKEINDFWDKYKDNPKLFKMNYPLVFEKYVKEYSFFGKSITQCYISCNFRSWLHDLLYKVE